MRRDGVSYKLFLRRLSKGLVIWLAGIAMMNFWVAASAEVLADPARISVGTDLPATGEPVIPASGKAGRTAAGSETQGSSLGRNAAASKTARQFWNWNLTPRVTVSETYTDNIELAPSGQEQGEFVTQINPGFNLSRKGPRLEANIDYQLQSLIYATQSSRDELFNQLDAHAKAEIIPEAVFLDADSTVSQQVIDPSQRVALNNISLTGNRTNVSRFSISPHAMRRFGNIGLATLRYSYGLVDFSEETGANSIADSTRNMLQFSFGSLPQQKRLSWVFNSTYDAVESAQGRSNLFETYGIDLSYALTSHFDVLGGAGYETNSFEGISIEDTQSPIGAIGFRWRPDALDQIEVRYGTRFFGNTYQVHLIHKERRLTAELVYGRDVGTLIQSLLGTTTFTLNLPGNTNIDIPIDTLTLTPEVFVRDRLDFNLALRLARGNVNLNIYDEQRKFIGTIDSGSNLSSEQSTGFTTSLDQSLTRQLTFISGFLFRHDEFLGIGDTTNDIGRFSAGLRWRYVDDTNITLEGSHTEEITDSAARDYNENAVSLSLIKQF